jgi:hypothetical protein
LYGSQVAVFCIFLQPVIHSRYLYCKLQTKLDKADTQSAISVLLASINSLVFSFLCCHIPLAAAEVWERHVVLCDDAGEKLLAKCREDAMSGNTPVRFTLGLEQGRACKKRRYIFR